MYFHTKQFEKILAKTRQMEETYEGFIFNRIKEIPLALYETNVHYRKTPKGEYRPLAMGDIWGGEGMTGWLCGEVTADRSLAGKKLFLTADTGAIETLLFVEDVPKGVFANRVVIRNRGNHHTQLLTEGLSEGTTLKISLEAYCWHNVPGNQPFAIAETGDRKAVFGGVFLCEMDETIKDFVFDLRTLNQLSQVLPDDFRRAEIENCLMEVYSLIPQKPEEVPWETTLGCVLKARAAMEKPLSARGADSAPYAGLVGHSHLDTAWQWTVDETVRKAARTISNAVSLMKQYPEYTFFQSSMLHGEMLRVSYPALFDEVKSLSDEGRYELGGGAYVECDCNLTGGESLVRQFLYGQQWSQTYLGRKSDSFWLPDTFGYSGAIPQILLGCGIRYFLTTKLSWNDSNPFPYDTFYWQGLDGSRVFCHMNDIGSTPDPNGVVGQLYGSPSSFRVGRGGVTNKRVSQSRLFSYGFGDGGGGPSYDMLEMARRVADLDGCPKSSHTTVSAFMNRLETEADRAPVHAGELYFEGHRGTYTSQSELKKINRMAERAMREMELLVSFDELAGLPVPDLSPLWKTVLLNQFHDILPGTSLMEVHDRALREDRDVIRQAEDYLAVPERSIEESPCAASLLNVLSFPREGFALPAFGQTPKGSVCQPYTDLSGAAMVYISGYALNGLSLATPEWEPYRDSRLPSPFTYTGDSLESPFYNVEFDQSGGICSLIDKETGRELRREGGLPLNSFLLGEDIPKAWDNWDIDEDVWLKLEPSARLEKRELISVGPCLIRLRSRWTLGQQSEILQDLVLYGDKPGIEFETQVDWHERHKLLKAAFDLNISCMTARHEIQFGYADRPAYRNNPYEQAMYEVVNHKYTDLSEPGFGAALLNDCKYGVSVNGSNVALTLLKGGVHPDTRADEGLHRFSYGLLPHKAFCAGSVVHPAYAFNYPVRLVHGRNAHPLPLAEGTAPNILVEAVKPSCDGDGVIFRLYECEGTGCQTSLRFSEPLVSVTETNLLEEELRRLEPKEPVSLSFRAFEIKTIKCRFSPVRGEEDGKKKGG